MIAKAILQYKGLMRRIRLTWQVNTSVVVLPGAMATTVLEANEVDGNFARQECGMPSKNDRSVGRLH